MNDDEAIKMNLTAQESQTRVYDVLNAAKILEGLQTQLVNLRSQKVRLITEISNKQSDLSTCLQQIQDVEDQISTSMNKFKNLS